MIDTYRIIEKQRLKEILNNIKNVRVGLIGDISLDVYWRADMTKSELSRETPHYPLPVVEEWMSPGAGGNAAANIAALKPAEIKVVSLTGRDWRGAELIRLLKKSGINTKGIIKSKEYVTNAYCKPLRKGISDLEYEDPRIDFCNYMMPLQHDEENLIKILDEICREVDVLCVSDQFEYGCITPAVRDKIVEVARNGLTVVVDSRYRIGLYSGVILKPNEIEGYRAVNKTGDPRNASFEELINTACTLAVSTNSQVCMTIGARGCLYTDGKEKVHIPAGVVKGPIDICGAGDTFLSVFSCSLAAGADIREAASIANLASGVTITKIGTTGTALPEEILSRYDEISVT